MPGWSGIIKKKLLTWYKCFFILYATCNSAKHKVLNSHLNCKILIMSADILRKKKSPHLWGRPESCSLPANLHLSRRKPLHPGTRRSDVFGALLTLTWGLHCWTVAPWHCGRTPSGSGKCWATRSPDHRLPQEVLAVHRLWPVARFRTDFPKWSQVQGSEVTDSQHRPGLQGPYCLSSPR